MVKQSIAKWEDQYSLTLPVVSESKDYAVGIEEFKSSAFNSTIDLKDINSIVITVVPPGAAVGV